MIDRVLNGYILVFIFVVSFTSIIDLLLNKFSMLKRFEFLNLMIYSVYCGIGVISSWNTFSWLYFVDDEIWTEGE